MSATTVDSEHLLIGTRAGIWRAPAGDIDGAERVLETGRVMRVHRFGDGRFAATRSGLYRSLDGGATWRHLGVPRREVYSVLESPDGGRLYAGTHPAHLYVSENGGESWRELEGLQDLPSRPNWRLPRHRNEAHVRSLVAHPDVPDRVVAGTDRSGGRRRAGSPHSHHAVFPPAPRRLRGEWRVASGESRAS